MRSMIFHYPGVVDADPKVGSGTHVTRTLEGFRDAGFSVEVVSGTSRERSNAMRRIVREARAGRVIELVYSKAATIPTALTDPHHVPLRPLVDARFFRAMRRLGIPVALFYPDVYWRFPDTRQRLARRLVYEALYRFDLAWYRRYVDLLLVPSMGMAAWIPGWEHSERVAPAYPGCVISTTARRSRDDGRLQIFYVGSVVRPLYDIEPLVAAVKHVRGASLTICCPDGTGDVYNDPESGISVIHGSGQVVRDAYAEADVAALVFEPVLYRTFAMPVKLFEAFGEGRPVLATRGTAAAEFVDQEHMGWSVDNAELISLLERLVARREEVEVLAQSVVERRAAHTWTVRAETVARRLGIATP